MDFKFPISFGHLKSIFLLHIFVISVWKIQVIFITSTQGFCVLNVVTNGIYFNIILKLFVCRMQLTFLCSFQWVCCIVFYIHLTFRFSYTYTVMSTTSRDNFCCFVVLFFRAFFFFSNLHTFYLFFWSYFIIYAFPFNTSWFWEKTKNPIFAKLLVFPVFSFYFLPSFSPFLAFLKMYNQL